MIWFVLVFFSFMNVFRLPFEDNISYGIRLFDTNCARPFQSGEANLCSSEKHEK